MRLQEAQRSTDRLVESLVRDNREAMSKVLERLDGIQEKMATRHQVEAVQADVSTLDRRLRDVEGTIARLNPMVEKIENRQERLETVAVRKEDLAHLEERLNERVKGVTTRVDAIHKERDEEKKEQKKLADEDRKDLDKRFKPLEESNVRASTLVWIIRFLGIGTILTLLGAIYAFTRPIPP